MKEERKQEKGKTKRNGEEKEKGKEEEEISPGQVGEGRDRPLRTPSLPLANVRAHEQPDVWVPQLVEHLDLVLALQSTMSRSKKATKKQNEGSAVYFSVISSRLLDSFWSFSLLWENEREREWEREK